MSATRKELSELAASTGTGMVARELLEKWLESDNNDELKEALRQLGLSEQAIMIIVAAAGYGGKLALRAAIKLHEDPEARAKARKVGIGVIRALGRAFGPNHRVGNTGLDWTTFPEKGD